LKGAYEIKQLHPIQVPLLLLAVAADVVHHHIRVIPKAVGQEKDFPARELEALEHVHDARLRLDVQSWVLSDPVLDHTVPVAQVNAASHILVQLLIRLVFELRKLVLVGILEGDELGVHKCIRKGEESVDVCKVFTANRLLVHVPEKINAEPTSVEPTSVVRPCCPEASVQDDARALDHTRTRSPIIIRVLFAKTLNPTSAYP